MLTFWATVALFLGSSNDAKAESPPNILVFIVDDLGYNQVEYHARRVGNAEIKTPNILKYAKEHGIELSRGYMTPWCGPSRAAMQSGRTNVYNANISNDLVSFDDDIGYVGGMPPGTKTIAKAFKEYGERVGKPYTTYFSGKWGIGGTAWTNTPMGMDYDFVRGFWGDSMESCDGQITPFTFPAIPVSLIGGGTGEHFGGNLQHVLPGYFTQNPYQPNATWCKHINSFPDDVLSPKEKFVACKTIPRDLPKIVDLDLLDGVIDNIRGHNYEKGPLLQIFATQMMHTPMQYPKHYDNNNPNNLDLPDYWRDTEEKPSAGITDQRLATANAVRYMDDLFGHTMEALKESGQWDNTIVYFTSDNGGAINQGTVNNNYPMRGQKFAAFEGGVHVPQFMTGGWLEQNLPPATLPTVSDTFIFTMDIGPTLLEMAGGSRSDLLGNRTGAVYGNALFEHIKASIRVFEEEEEGAALGHQMERKVSYDSGVFFEVSENATYKNYHTGSLPILSPRHWSPSYPQEDDLMPDFGYLVINPCRPKGIPTECCRFELTGDPRELVPLDTDCEELLREAQMEYDIEGGCEQDENGVYNNNMCIEPGYVRASGQGLANHPTSNYSLFTHMKAAGPFTTSEGVPIPGESMKCVCHGIEAGTRPGSIDYYTPTVFSPSECAAVNQTYIDEAEDPTPPNLAVACDGSQALGAEAGKSAAFFQQGIDQDLFRKVEQLEQQELIGVIFGNNANFVYEMYLQYAFREGHTEWPNIGKFPFIGFGLDSCPEKDVTPIPFATVGFPPYVLGFKNPTLPYTQEEIETRGLCQAATATYSYCPSVDNALMVSVDDWVVKFGNASQSYGILSNGERIEPFLTSECSTRCPAAPEVTAFIGGEDTLPIGLQVVAGDIAGLEDEVVEKQGSSNAAGSKLQSGLEPETETTGFDGSSAGTWLAVSALSLHIGLLCLCLHLN